MRASLFLAVVLVLSGCDRGDRAELERQNAELKQEKALLEKALAEARAELAKAEEARTATAAAAAAVNDPTQPPTSEDERTLQAAQDAYVHGDYTRAIQLAKKTVASVPSKSWRIVGAANCFLRDRAAALDAYRHLGAQERAFLRYVCTRNSVQLD